VERTRSYEVGTKWNLLGEALSLTLAAFQTETTNARATDANGTVVFVGRKRVKGIELSASGNITERWAVFGGYTYMDRPFSMAAPRRLRRAGSPITFPRQALASVFPTRRITALPPTPPTRRQTASRWAPTRSI
jgi:catecholate siderophore receptor